MSDILVNSAALSARSTVETFTPESFDEVVHTNLRAPLLLAQAALPDLTAGQLDPAWFQGRRRIGVTAGASAPEVLVDQLLAALKGMGAGAVRTLDGVTEDVVFPMPKGLSRATPRPEPAT